MPVPKVTSIAKSWWKALQQPVELIDVCNELWYGDPPVYEHRLAAVKLLRLSKHVLVARDLDTILGYAATAKTWALLDELCGHVLPILVAAQGRGDGEAVLRGLASSDDFWMRRACLLCHQQQLKAGDVHAFDSFVRFATPMLTESEPFIRKAVGWMLREAAPRLAERVADFCCMHATALSTVTYNEATRKLPPQLKARVAEARKRQD